MALQGKVATRYAKAIFDLVKDEKQLKDIADELSHFADALSGHEELQRVLSTDLFSNEIRRKVIEDVISKIKVSIPTKKILLTISDLKRVKELKAIAERLKLLRLEAGGVLPLRVQAASPLSDVEKRNVEDRFEILLGKKVEASYEVDASLIGGLRITAAGRTYDGSLAGWLTHFEEKLGA